MLVTRGTTPSGERDPVPHDHPGRDRVRVAPLKALPWNIL
jgi:hypothetical protein